MDVASNLIDSLIEFVKDSIEFFLPFTVLEYYEKGVLLRLGVPRKRKAPGWWWLTRPIKRFKLRKNEREEDCVVGPGLVWHYPCNIDAILTTNVVFETQVIDDLQAVTRDGIAIDAKPVIGYSIPDVRKFLLDVEDASDAVIDASGGVVVEAIRKKTWEEIKDDPSFVTKIKGIVARRANDRFGVEVETMYFHSLVPLGLKTGVIKVVK